MWETNFVPDLAAIELKSWGDRGAGGTNIMFVLADGTMHAHISEMPVGTYKKGAPARPELHVMCVTGQGYSLLWYEHDKDFRRIDWKHGMVLCRRTGSSTSISIPAGAGALSRHGGRRLALSDHAGQCAFHCSAPVADDLPAVSKSVKDGGDQIEYEDQDPRIHRIWLEDMRKHGAPPKMEKFVPTPEDLKTERVR